MPIQLPAPKPHSRFGDWSGPTLTATAVSLAGASAIGALALMLSPPLVLPVIGVLATLAAVVVALIAWATAQRMAAAITYWDVAGALTLIGIVATLLSEPELVLAFLDNQRTE